MDVLLEEMLNCLSIESVNEVFPHEQTITGNIKRLKEAMLNIGQLVDPLIIDRDSKVVLDGNHRLKVLQILECPLASCQLVDYKSPKIQVGTWFPVTTSPVEEIFKSDKLKFERIECEKGKASLSTMAAPFMAVQNTKGDAKVCNAHLIDPGKYKLREMIEEQNFILSSLKNVEFSYIPDYMADEYLANGYTVLFRRPFTKSEIIQSAKEHTPFPPKSTRHSIPDRIIRLNMRLGWLHESKEGALKHQQDLVSQRAYDGNVRRYSEPVIVIY